MDYVHNIVKNVPDHSQAQMDCYGISKLNLFAYILLHKSFFIKESYPFCLNMHKKRHAKNWFVKIFTQQ